MAFEKLYRNALKEHPRWPGGKKFIRENSTIHRVHLGSIMKELGGSWVANGMWELKDTVRILSYMYLKPESG